jgi:hypothetical protein
VIGHAAGPSGPTELRNATGTNPFATVHMKG